MDIIIREVGVVKLVTPVRYQAIGDPTHTDQPVKAQLKAGLFTLCISGFRSRGQTRTVRISGGTVYVVYGELVVDHKLKLYCKIYSCTMLPHFSNRIAIIVSDDSKFLLHAHLVASSLSLPPSVNLL